MTAAGAAPGPAIVSYYFLDWRPIGALPVDRDRMTVRRKSFTADELIQHLEDCKGSTPVAIPQMNLCAGAQVLARQDGLFVLRLDVSSGFPPSDVDEMALVACSYVKLRLGHVHDVHRASRRPTNSKLTPSKVLIVYPVRLPTKDWTTRFRNGSFTDEHLKEARGERPADLSTREPARLALITLRHAYLRIFEDLLGRLAIDRGQQTGWRDGVNRFLALPLLVILATLLYALTARWPTKGPASADLLAIILFYGRSAVEDPYFAISLLTAPALFAVFSNLSEVRIWEVPRIQLLRSAVLFYEYANPLNRVIREVLGRESDHFHDLIGALKTKVEGEVHRSSQNYANLAVFVSTVGVVLALLAIKDVQEKAQAKPASPAQVIAMQAGPAPPGKSSAPPAVVRRPKSAPPEQAAAPVPPPATPAAPAPEGPPAPVPTTGGEAETLATPAEGPSPAVGN